MGDLSFSVISTVRPV